MPLRDFLMLVALCFIWGLNVIVSRIAVSDLHVPPLLYAALRTMVVAAALFPFLRHPPAELGRVLVTTLLIGAGGFALFFIGLRTATPSSAAVVSLLGAPMTVVFAILFLGEKVGWRRGLGIALTLAGVLVVVIDPSGLHGSVGLWFVAASATASALGTVWLKRLTASPVQLQAWGGVSGMLALIPLTLLLEDNHVAATIDAGWGLVAAVCFSGILVSVVAHTAYYGLIQRHDANVIAPLTLMTPLFTIVLGVLLTGDPVGPALIIGALLAIAGVLVIAIRPSMTFPKWLLVRNRM